MFTIEERVFLVEYVFREGGKYTRNVREKFSERFPNTRRPNRDSVHNIVNKFRATGSVHDVPRSGRPTVLTDEKLDEIANIMLRNPKTSTRKLAKAAGISMWTAHKAVINKLQLNAHQVNVENMRVHELKDVGTEAPTVFHESKDVQTQVATAAFHESKYVQTEVPTSAFHESKDVKTEVPTTTFHELKDVKTEMPTAALHESKDAKQKCCIS